MAKLQRTRRSRAVSRAFRDRWDSLTFITHEIEGSIVEKDGSWEFVVPPLKGKGLKHFLQVEYKKFAYDWPSYIDRYF